MLNYARSDTHYLLSSFDQLKIELFKLSENPLIEQVFEKSAQISAMVWIRWAGEKSLPKILRFLSSRGSTGRVI